MVASLRPIVGMRGLWVTAAILALGGLAACGGDESATRGERPRAAPSFSVERLGGGENITNSSLSGTPTIVNFWASWCTPCREEMPALAKFAKNSATVRVVGIATSDDAGDAQKFADQVDVDYTLGIDPDGKLLGRFGATGLPATYVLNSDGEVVRTSFGAIDLDEIDALVAGVG